MSAFTNLFKRKEVPFKSERKKNKIKRKFSAFALILMILFIIYTVTLLLLLVWAFNTSLKIDEKAFKRDPIGLTKDWAFVNFAKVFQYMQNIPKPTGGKVGLFAMLMNTILYAGVGSVIAAMVPCLVAYAVAKFPCKFSKLLNYIVIVTMILPIVGSYSSEMKILEALGLYDKMYGTWIQKFNFLGMYFLVYLGMINGLGKEYWEAAYIDGANQYSVLFRIILPLLKNTIMLVVLVQFIDLWNNFQAPLLYVPSSPTLAYGIYFLGNLDFREGISSTPMRMACSMVFAVPMLILFIIFKDKLMGNLTMGGVKE